MKSILFASSKVTFTLLLFSTLRVSAQVPGTLPKPPDAPTVPAIPASPAASVTVVASTVPAAITQAVQPTVAVPAIPAAPAAAMAQTSASTPADSAAAKLDAAISANAKGDKAAAVSALNAGVAAAEAQAATSKGDFKSKLMSQVGNLKKLIPGVKSGLVKASILSKAVSFVKMALGANQISNLLGGGGSLSGSAAGLTGGLNLLKGALPSLGGPAASSGGSLISTALAGVSSLGGLGGAAAEPAVKQQLGGVLNFAKGLL